MQEASQLASQGYYKEAKPLMTEKDKLNEETTWIYRTVFAFVFAKSLHMHLERIETGNVEKDLLRWFTLKNLFVLMLVIKSSGKIKRSQCRNSMELVTPQRDLIFQRSQRTVKRLQSNLLGSASNTTGVHQYIGRYGYDCFIVVDGDVSNKDAIEISYGRVKKNTISRDTMLVS